MLAQKDLEEEEALKEMCKQAAAELQEWHNRHEEQMTQTKSSNRQVRSKGFGMSLTPVYL